MGQNGPELGQKWGFLYFYEDFNIFFSVNEWDRKFLLDEIGEGYFLELMFRYSRSNTPAVWLDETILRYSISQIAHNSSQS